MNSRFPSLTFLFIAALALVACTRTADKLPDPGTTAPELTHPAPAPGQAAAGAATPDVPLHHSRIIPIPSDFTCKDRVECTFTKYANSPRSHNDCKCAAECTPYVVNSAEKERRETANKRFCTSEDWFGDDCPEIPCSFMEFESFKCEAGKCVGMALGK
ncbi:MAG: hypothetical protein WC683_00560 [bacterium]